jgi:hypothetical protein
MDCRIRWPDHLQLAKMPQNLIPMVMPISQRRHRNALVAGVERQEGEDVGAMQGVMDGVEEDYSTVIDFMTYGH